MLDEGDRLLDEGFEDDVLALSRMASNRKQTMLLSATWSSDTQKLQDAMLRSEEHQLRIAVSGVPLTITQQVEMVPRNIRGRRLRELLKTFGKAKVLVFALLKREAKELAKMLADEGWSAWALQGDMSQAARSQAVLSFRTAEAAVLVATDVAARGLDISGVTHVVNFSLGLSVDSYVHRIGRCGRAGRRGTAVTFVTDGDERHAASLLRFLREARQAVPEGLEEMALMYDRSDGAQLAIKNSGAKGEMKIVLKAGTKEEVPEERKAEGRGRQKLERYDW